MNDGGAFYSHKKFDFKIICHVFTRQKANITFNGATDYTAAFIKT